VSPARAALGIIAAATALRVGFAAIADLGLDEAYALAVSRQFQLSWFDHPPLLFWIVGAVQAVFGLEVPTLVLRLPFIALAVGTTWLLFRLTQRHFGGIAALWTVALFTVAPFFFLSAGSWLVPDGPLCFFLMIAALALSRIVAEDKASPHWRTWLVAGTALGLALLSKYHAALFALGAAFYFLASPRLRGWFLRPQPYIAVLVALVLFSPVIIWNAQNEWASFAFQLGRGAAVTGSSPGNVGRLLLFEIAYLLPTTAILLVAALVWAIARPSPSASFFLALGLPIVLLLDATRFWTWQSYAHWSMPGWMLLLPLLGAMLAAWRRPWPLAVAAISGLQFAVLLVGAALVVTNVRIGGSNLQGYRIEGGTWTGVAGAIRVAGAIDADPLIVTAYWRDAARIAEALRTDLPVLVFDYDPRGFAWTVPADILGRDAIIVSQYDIPTRFAGYFEHFEPIGAFPIQPGEGIPVVNVARGHNLLKLYPLPYGPR
jgi:4-amino-4-deoxy-L-arabinose transferase-like glycosyltransferase